jgi:hypothetical protein
MSSSDGSSRMEPTTTSRTRAQLMCQSGVSEGYSTESATTWSISSLLNPRRRTDSNAKSSFSGMSFGSLRKLSSTALDACAYPSVHSFDATESRQQGRYNTCFLGLHTAESCLGPVVIGNCPTAATRKTSQEVKSQAASVRGGGKAWVSL